MARTAFRFDVAKAVPWLACALTGLVIFAFQVPGNLVPDSMSQLAQSRSGDFTDWHPPIMALVWRGLGSSVPAMLFLQTALHWFGIACMADALRRRGRSPWQMVAAGFFPLLMSFPGTILKDALLSAAFVAAAGAAVRFGKLAAIAPATLGLLTRMNGVFALPPLFTRRLWLCILLSAALIPASIFINRTVIGAENGHADKSLRIFDVAGTRHFAGEEVDCYTPFQWDSLNRCGAEDPGSATWLRTIASHPMAYAQHRIAHYNLEIMWLVSAQHQCAYAYEAYRCEQRYRPLAYELLNNPFIWPVTWLFVGMALLCMRPDPTVRMLCLSGLIYGGAYLGVGVAYDTMRYYFWTEMAVLMALIWHRPSDKQRQILAWGVAVIWSTGLIARVLL